MKMLSFERDGSGRRPSKPQQGKNSSGTSDDSLLSDVYLDSVRGQRCIDQPSNYQVLAPEKESHLRSLVESQNCLYSRDSEDEISVKYHWGSPSSRKRSNSSSPDSSGDNLGVFFRDENNEWEEGLETKCLLKEEEQMNSSSSCSTSRYDREVLKPTAQNASSILRFGWFSGSNNGSNGGSSIDNKDYHGYDEEIAVLLNDFDKIQAARHVAFDVESFQIVKTDSDDIDQQLWALDSDDDKLSPPPPATKNTSVLDMNLLCLGPFPCEADFLPLGGAFASECLTRRHSEPSKRSSKYSMTRSHFMVHRKKKRQKPNPWDKSFASARDFQSQLETVKEERDEEKSVLLVPNTTTISWGEDESKMKLLTTFEGCCSNAKPLRTSSKKRGEKKSPVPRLVAWMSRGKSSQKSTLSKTTHEDADASSDEWSCKPTEVVQLEEKPSSVSSFDTTSEWSEAIEAFTTFNIGETSAFAPYGSVTVTSAKMRKMVHQQGETGEI